MSKIKTHALVEGAVLAALTAILGIFYNMPIVGILTMFWAVPIIIVGYRNGFRVSLIAASVAAVLVSVFATPIVGLILFSTYAIPGAVMGYMLRKKISIHMTLAVCSLLLAVTAVLQFFLSLELILGIGIIDILKDPGAATSGYYAALFSQTKESAELYRQFGYGDAEINQAMEQIQAMLNQVMLLMPAGFLFSGIVGSYINFKAVKVILNRIGYKLEDVKSFSQWSLGKGNGYILLGITLVVLMFNSLNPQLENGLLTNIWAILLLVYSVLGLSVLKYLVEKLGSKYEVPKAVQGLAYAFLIIITLGILPYIGMFDIAADIRRFERNIRGGVQ